MTWHLMYLLLGAKAHILHKLCIHSRILYSIMGKTIVSDILYWCHMRCSRFKEPLWRQPPAKWYLAKSFLIRLAPNLTNL